MSRVRIKVFEGVCSVDSLEYYMNSFLSEGHIKYVGHSVSVSRENDYGEYRAKDKQSYAGSVAYEEV
jgi:hypothetical protein